MSVIDSRKGLGLQLNMVRLLTDTHFQRDTEWACDNARQALEEEDR